MTEPEDEVVIVPVLGRIGDPPPPPTYTVRATAWVTVRQTDAMREQINQLVSLIGEVVEHTKTSNLPLDGRAISEIERVQLIAVLETALAMLKAPMIEKNLLKKAASMLKRAAAKAVEKQVENAFAFAAGFAAGKITELLPYL